MSRRVDAQEQDPVLVAAAPRAPPRTLSLDCCIPCRACAHAVPCLQICSPAVQLRLYAAATAATCVACRSALRARRQCEMAPWTRSVAPAMKWPLGPNKSPLRPREGRP
eukprot:CAMPEP_0174713466 /NCGR_PEP_ID=MMETSP1094-20130205/14121_1 /TAXON_ID=156173 /ORGANISM="Chrysochromulina brevifilum, Strain UTEX LB 985" /LENGTH=108 /DNA_ID=CAMNT_0015912645 /DNA_START=188 /DNA_END=510 /DNA_ORIENTATION=-